MREADFHFLERGADQREKLARMLATDKPGTAIERWRRLCLNSLCAYLLAAGRDVTVIVGQRTDRSSGEFAVVLPEDRN